MRREEIELLAPAGSYEGFEAAIGAGADAVYVGGAAFGARAYAKNFGEEELLRAIDTAHIHGRKLYLTVNTLLKNRELSEQLYDYLLPYYKEGLDAVIVQDMGVFKMIREMFPGMHLHASTQMTVTGPEGMKFLEEQGASRVVTARELSLEEIRRMHETSPIEIESFVHGALCYSYSGQCLMSSILGGRSGNRGRCAQPCRLPYQTALCCGENGRRSEKRKAQELCPLSLKDISTIEILPQILEAGVTSLKIEGRMKTALYVATVARTYRKAIDDYKKDPQLYRDHMEWYRQEIGKCTYREFTTGFYFGKPTEDAQIYDNNTYVKNYAYLGTVLEVDGRGRCLIQQKNKFCVGDTIEVMKPDGRNLELTVAGMEDEEGNAQDSAPHPKQVLWIDLGMDADLEVYDILRKKEESA